LGGDLQNPFAVDIRALAALRVAVGTLLIADLLIRWSDVGWFMSDYGAYSVAASKAAASDWRLSLYWLADGLWWVHTLFAANIAVALLLIAGVRTRWVTFFAFVLLVSLHNRNPILLQGGDNLLVLLLFWGLFLPWGERLSVDATMVAKPSLEQRYVGGGSVALVLQILSVYFFSAFLKNGSEWTVDGTAIYYALHNDQVAHLLAPYWRDWHWLTVPLTHYVWWLELLGPIVALSPWFNAWARGLAAFCFITLEIGFLFNLNVGLFPFISIASLLVLLPTQIWDYLARVFAPKPHAPMVMYYDKTCVFCHKTCVLIRSVFALNARVEPAQDTPEVGTILEQEFSWVLEVEGNRYLRWAALVECVRRGGRFTWIAYPLSAVGVVGDSIYTWIGHNRGAFGRLTSVAMPWRDEMPRPGRIRQSAALAAAAVVLAGNVSALPSEAKAKLSDSWLEGVSQFYQWSQPLVQTARLDQLWNMFAPYPQKNDGWFLMVGLTEDGALVDVLRWQLTPPVTDKPRSFVPEQAQNYRWRKYLARMKRSGYTDEMGRYASAACARWNALVGSESAPKQGELAPPWPTLEAFNIYYVLERTPPMGEQGEVAYQLLWRHHCLDKHRLSENAVQKAMLATAADNMSSSTP
jgi:predicted DCC family thiol-disulfide oxidoreductase YuxK